MTILAGAVSSRGGVIPDDLIRSMRSALSRNPAHVRQEHRQSDSYLCKADIGAYAPAFRVSASGSVSMAAGHPWLTDTTGDRSKHLESLHDSWDRNEWSVLERARGTYCAVHYDPATRVLSLVGDKLGVRPLYYWVGRDYVVFASALRILEAVAAVPKVLDLRGVTELVAFGHPLGRRTPYAGIQTLHSGEAVHVSQSGISLRRYWAWDAIAAADADAPINTRRIHQLFVSGVRDRLGADATPVAFLSGGLDSRCVVSVLCQLGARVRSYTFFRGEQSQDAVLASKISAALGTEHSAAPWLEGAEGAIGMMRLTLAASASGGVGEAIRRVVWSGDGGSVGVGLVYVDPDIVQLMRHGKEQEAIDLFLSRHGGRIGGRPFRRAIGAALHSAVIEGALAELAAFPGAEPGRRFHLFLMTNNQRRHLSQYYEEIDLNNFEMELPFFDADFLTAVLSAPFDASLLHGLYARWLDEFPSVTRSVPWQAYPGHVPCPLPVPKELTNQWDQGAWYSRQRSWRRARTRGLLRVILARDFPSRILSRWDLMGYLLAGRMGLADDVFASGVAETYYRYWSRCGGVYVVPPLGSP